MKTSAVILAGGRGRRMGGRNKALLTVGSEAFIDRQIRTAAAWTDEVIVVAGEGEFARELRVRYGVAVVPDLYEGEGPLAGVHAGFAAVRNPYVWLLACDQPWADSRAASLLLDRLLREGAAAALPMIGGRPQPFHAVYRSDVGLTAGELLEQGERRMFALLDRISWTGMAEEDFRAAGVPDTFAEDVDTPEDYKGVRLGRDPDIP
ncbi:NTP transferase domain-containing protein [Cohnella sp. CFH 77786]|uniref:molybdenum cofactor guanylyltransferase n=1 Tax=Cohnella sp. CFH 77786 TaxID=2662265 RepID=UPI001C60EC8E|nr:molybdenum cofactor guanylyltransferase [Cohnella sp. CFH 77786]MBW5445021.1 NTP transferase domain-containing protein [Cohnella sp. CFH 77786]